MKTTGFFLTLVFTLFLSKPGFAQDPNLHIYLCLGQSNMEGKAKFEAQDTIINERFRVLQAVDCPTLNREMGKWYAAKPPLCRCSTGLTPADYFGKKLVSVLPDSIKVGVINVSVGGCKIEIFDEEKYESYIPTTPDWLQSFVAEYDGNPYRRLVEMAKLAQKDGVIKGILLHQGESNTGDIDWPKKVQTVYTNLLDELNLKAEDVPLLAGELVHESENGACAGMNKIIGTLPQIIPTSHIISSEGCERSEDRLHFSSAGYRKLGTRYADKMLELLGYVEFD